MFLKKSRSRTELFVILPDKPKKLMTSVQQKEKEKMKTERSFVMNENELERRLEAEKNNNNNSVLSKEFSELMWMTPNQQCNGSLEHREIFDIMNMGKKYDKFKNSGLHHEAGDYGYHGDCSDQSLTSSDDFSKSPTRLSPKERKSVRFEDELSDSVSSVDGNVYPFSARQVDIESQRRNENFHSRVSDQRTRKLDPFSTKDGDTSDRQGLLGRTLWHNPLNLNRGTGSSMESNFICHQCEKTFKYQSNLRTHIKNIHSTTLWRRSGTQANLRSIDDLFICDICSLAFKYSVNFRAHKAGHARSKLNATI